MKNLLLDEHPLVILPSLASEIGLNESIIIQQLHYWIQASGKEKAGHLWVYNTYDKWREQFPFWSQSTIRRTINNLEKNNLIITGNFNKLKIDKTKWYRINYDKVSSMNSPSVQNEQSTCSNRAPLDVFNLNRPLPETTETNIYIVEIIDYLNKKTGKKFSKSTAQTRKSINARMNDGFTVDDFKKVIDIKTADWLNTEMDKYLRPATLFGTKFESYLNESVNQQPTPPNNPSTKSAQTFDINEGEDW